ncbi:MAG TPA: helix-turn-helix transcriptional regulator [Patescibacteria group bacterium]|nr:helix-turn-helix transcriptional regulator [Patescibacteria group bacterium]
MSGILSYTPEEVAKLLKISRFTVYEMIKRGDLAGYRVGRKVRVDSPDLDAYIQKSKDRSHSPAKESCPPAAAAVGSNALILCGQDVVLDILARHLEKELPQQPVLRHHFGSVDGLLALYRRSAQLVTAHLWDSDTDTYNLPYIRRILAGHRTLIINLMYRWEGFYVARGNPLGIKDWTDLARPGIRLVNREPGSGARVLLDEQLRLLDIDQRSISGYDREESSHLAVASYVARGDADVGVGIEKTAQQVANIDFLPLKNERYDLVLRREDEGKPYYQVLLSVLRSTSFQNQIAGLGGYDLTHTGQIMGET